jgi:catechol 2,3-dioxygenase-like lactoylglutathione lyase family enzyme
MALDYVGELTCALGVTDLKRSIDWYQTILGLDLMYHAEDIGWCELTSSVAKVSVGLGQVETARQGGGATLVWGVADIDAAKRHLDAHGIPQDGKIEHIPGLVKLLSFCDPDGNALKFSQSLIAG